MAVKRAARWDLLSASLGPALDGANDVIEVVGDAAGQLADGFKLLHLAELLFERPPLGHVLGDAFEASDTDRGVPRRPPRHTRTGEPSLRFHSTSRLSTRSRPAACPSRCVHATGSR